MSTTVTLSSHEEALLFEPLAVDARGLTKIYRQGDRRLPALDAVTFQVPLGGVTAIIGPSGSGKSTLLHLLAGLTRPDEGELRVVGKNIRQMSPRALARFRNQDVGVIFQAFNLLPDLTARENVLFPLTFSAVDRHEGEERARILLETVGLGAAMHRFPNHLSGGEQQRVAIARALVTNPSVVLADEPTGNLDDANRDGIRELLFHLANEFAKTVILVTHHREIALEADRRLGIRDGRIVPEDEVLCF